MKKRVLLVNANTERAPYPVPPLGLCLVAHRVGKGRDVRLFDGMFRPPGELAEELAAFAPDVVGLSIRNIDDVVMAAPTYYVDAIAEAFVRPIRAYGRAALVLGGSGFSVFPRELLEAFGADCGVVSEGEEPFAALLDAREAGRDPSGIPGLVHRRGDEIAVNPPSPRDGALALPDSRIDALVDYAPYRGRGSYPVQTKRGCAHGCVYCTYPCIEGRRYRLRAPTEVASEIARIRERLGDVSVEIVDSTFNDPPGHAEAICDAIVRAGVGARLRTMGVNPAGVSAALVTGMRRAGFAQVDCTPDSASPRVLAALGKNFGRERLEVGARVLAECGMPTMWFFLLGGPGETRTTLAETFDFVDRFVQPHDMVHLTSGIRIYPGTALAARAVEEGVIRPDQPLLRPTFYVSPALGPEALAEIVAEAASRRPNCVPAEESTPAPEMMREALALRESQRLDEPMFRTLLRVRRGKLEK
jgi:radical SAM superfamily enzyme YgiQ (UPF0313 family)